MYLWILIVSGFMSFFAAAGIGANDVANAFSTSIGSTALNMKSALIIASIFELSGALLMGSHVTETIRKGIADYQCFEDNPYVLMYGCMYVLFSVGLWLFLASKYEMPVSTTHSCVGGMIGMTIALGGVDCVNWYTIKDTFPLYWWCIWYCIIMGFFPCFINDYINVYFWNNKISNFKTKR